MVVKPGKETIEQRNRNGRTLVEEIQKGGAKEVVAARRLMSGDVVVTTTHIDARKEIQTATGWLEAFGEGAKVKRHVYTVLAHGIRMAHIDINKQEDAIKEIYRQNPILKDAVEILAVHWTKRSLKLMKTYAPLLIDVAEPVQANRLIDTGLIWEYQLHDCEPFVGDCRSTQCFKCFRYGHIARACGNVARCGFCAAPGHETNDCLQKNTPENHRCAACASPAAKHKAWSPTCPVRQGRVAQARQVYSQRPTRFQERGPVLPRIDPEPAVPQPSAEGTLLSTVAPLAPQIPVIARRETGVALEAAEAMDGLVVPGNQVGSKRALVRDSSSDDEEPLIRPPTKSRPGRPKKIATAHIGSQSITDFLVDHTTSSL